MKTLEFRHQFRQFYQYIDEKGRNKIKLNYLQIGNNRSRQNKTKGKNRKYDNENSYTSQMVRTIKYMAEL